MTCSFVTVVAIPWFNPESTATGGGVGLTTVAVGSFNPEPTATGGGGGRNTVAVGSGLNEARQG
jgi:hypothetical protein